MGVIGCLGDIVFTVSSRTVETIDKCNGLVLLGIASTRDTSPTL